MENANPIELPARHQRFKDAPWYSTDKIYVLVGGAGGIGSWTTFFLARAGFYPMVYDFDTVEAHNMAGQLFCTKDIGQPKVAAIRKTCNLYVEQDIIVRNEAITKDSPTHLYCVAAFDNMEARKTMFEKWVTVYGSLPDYKGLFIDPRLLMENIWVYAIKSGDTETIERHMKERLPDDATLPPEQCSLKQTTHTAAMTASIIVSIFTNHITNIKTDTDRVIPYETTLFTPLMMFNTK